MKTGVFKKVLVSTLSVAMLATSFSIPAAKSNTVIAATIQAGADYSVEAVDTSSSVSTLKFKTQEYSKYVIAHYKLDNGNQMNVTLNTSNGYDFTYDITGVKAGTKVKVSFTYNKGNAQYDTAETTYTTGTQTSTNTNIAAPFGVVAENRGNNEIGVVWGRGDINTYNIYVDNNKVASSVGCAYYVIQNIAAGNHTVSVTTVSGSSESTKSSVVVNVTGAQTQPQTTTTKKPETTTKKVEEGIVTIYQDINYGGRATALNEGSFDMGDLNAKGFYNDDMTSIKVKSGYRAIIYKDIHFTGESKVITSNTSWIGSDWNDQMTSIKVEKIPAATTTKAQPTTTKAQTSSNEYANAAFLGDGAMGGALSNTYKAVVVSGSNVTPNNIQNFQGITAIHVILADADISRVTVNGNTSTGKVEGAGLFINVNDLTKESNEVLVYNGAGNVKANIHVYNAKSTGQTQPVTTTKAQNQTTTKAQNQPTTSGVQFQLDTSIAKPFGLVLSNPDDGIISAVWGAGNINCYNVYVDGVRKRTKVQAGVQQIPVQVAGKHTVSIATVSGTRESERISMDINVKGTAPAETTDYPSELKPQKDPNIQKQNGKMILQLNNKTNGKYSDNQIYWIVLGKNANHELCYLDTNGNLVKANTGLNNGTIGSRKYAKSIVHTMAEKNFVHLPAIESGRMYISYGEPVYVTFNQGADGILGYAGPDVNNPGDANINTLFEYFEFTTEAINGGITFHGNTTRVDFFSFPYMIRLMDEYGGFDRCVGDIGTRSEIFNAFQKEVPAEFRGLANDKRIMAPCKTLFNEGRQYGNYFENYVNQFWDKYSREDLVFSCEGGQFRGRVEGNRMRFTKDGAGAYYVSKPNTQEILEGKGAFAQGSVVEKVIQAQLCAAFNRGVAMTPANYNKPSTYYKTESTYNAYAGFFHKHSVSSKAYGFCYDDVNDQSTLVETGNADSLVIDLKY